LVDKQYYPPSIVKPLHSNGFPDGLPAGKRHGDGILVARRASWGGSVNGENFDREAFDLAALPNAGDLTHTSRRSVYDVIVSGVIEGSMRDGESVVQLIEPTAGRNDEDEYRRRIITVSGRPDRRGAGLKPLQTGQFAARGHPVPNHP
jgi:hypothetical protein